MDDRTTPASGGRRVKPGSCESGHVGAMIEDVRKAEGVLKQAQCASGLAAYHHFFALSTPATRAAYESAMAAEAEAEGLLLHLQAASPTVDAPEPPGHDREGDDPWSRGPGGLDGP